MVALSGGSDSVALAHVCRLLHDAGDLIFAGVAHLNHRLRADAEVDAAFCEAVAVGLQVPCETAEADVAGHAAAHGLSIEAAAHDERYAFLRAAAGRLHADRVALAHTMDDQAETVLLRLVRGAGSRGLAGMYPRHGLFVRPLLDVRRDALRSFLRDRGASYRDDPTNTDRRIPRNRIRAELLPALVHDYNPRIVENLAQQAEIARDEWAWLQQSATELTRAALTGESPEWRLAVAPLRNVHPAVARAALREVLEQAAGGRAVTAAHVNGLLALVLAETDGAADFPGQRVERRGPQVVLRSRLTARGRGADTLEQPTVFSYPLAIPGEVGIPEAGATVSAGVGRAEAGQMSWSERGDRVAIRLDRDVGAAWVVRSRKPGDRLTLNGLAGRKKLQDLFVDRKVPREQRDRIPLVVDDRDRIVWVPGHGVAGEFRVTDPAQAVIILTLRLWGGPA